LFFFSLQNGSTTHIFKFRYIVLIDNVGVSLLEREAYPQAMDTLKDAICIMKQALGPVLQSDTASSDHNGEKVNKAFRLLMATNMTDRCNKIFRN
jgi:hypothetical protein